MWLVCVDFLSEPPVGNQYCEPELQPGGYRGKFVSEFETVALRGIGLQIGMSSFRGIAESVETGM